MAVPDPSPARADAPSPARWVEPTSRLPLRWGTYPERFLLGGALIIAGTTAVAGSNTYTLWLLLVGTITLTVGWCILPAKGWRRVAALPGAIFGAWLLLTGPDFIWVLVLPYAGWLLVRHRPSLSYTTLAIVLGGTILISRIFTTYAQMPIAYACGLAVFVLAAWTARAAAIADWRRRRARRGEFVR